MTSSIDQVIGTLQVNNDQKSMSIRKLEFVIGNHTPIQNIIPAHLTQDMTEAFPHISIKIIYCIDGLLVDQQGLTKIICR